jgi:uncharacterized protein (TIGR03083 family)
MADDLSELIRAERLALIEFLEQLTPAQWATDSLCSGWTVQDVAAHIAWTPALPPMVAARGFARAGFRVNTFIADSAVRWSRRGTAAILDQLRRNAADGAKPIGVPAVAALADAVVHAMDIRRPLNNHRVIPHAAYAPTADFFAGPSSRWPMSIPLRGNTRKRIAGLRLVAQDVEWAHGHGPDVCGSGEAVMLVLTGRPVGPGELTGPGAAELYARL